jgi:hypothetical protein
MIRVILIGVVSLSLLSSAIQAQTQAFCGFMRLLPTTVNIPNSGAVAWSPAGINDYNTVVG